MNLFKVTPAVFLNPEHVMISRLSYPERAIFDVEFILVDNSSFKQHFNSSAEAETFLNSYWEHCENG